MGRRPWRCRRGLWRSELNQIGSNLIDTGSCTHRRGGSGWCRKCQRLLGFARRYNCWPHWQSSNTHFPKGAPATCIQERDHTWIYVLYVGMTRWDYMYADTPDALVSQLGMDWHRGPSFLQISVQHDSIEFLASPAGMAKYIWCFYVILYVVYMWLGSLLPFCFDGDPKFPKVTWCATSDWVSILSPRGNERARACASSHSWV